MVGSMGHRGGTMEEQSGTMGTLWGDEVGPWGDLDGTKGEWAATVVWPWWDRGGTMVGPRRKRLGPWWDHGDMVGPDPPSPPQLSSFEMAVSFAVISFASQARVIVSTSEDEAADADEVLRRLENMTFAGASRWPRRGPRWPGRGPRWLGPGRSPSPRRPRQRDGHQHPRGADGGLPHDPLPEGAGGADGPPRGLAGRPPRRHPADGRWGPEGTRPGGCWGPG